MTGAEILIVEDDPELADVLRLGFEQVRHSVAIARDGGDAVRMAETGVFRAIVLDVLLPVLDGFQVASELRRRGNTTPILMLTARDSVADVVHGLDSGAEDYVTKPFSFLELHARIRALMRRAEPAAGRLEAGDLVMDTRAHRVMRAGREIDLTKTEYRVLEVLMRSAGQVVLRRDLIAAGWHAHVDDNSLDVTMSALRSAVDKGFPRRLIRTVRGFGYRLETP